MFRCVCVCVCVSREESAHVKRGKEKCKTESGIRRSAAIHRVSTSGGGGGRRRRRSWKAGGWKRRETDESLRRGLGPWPPWGTMYERKGLGRNSRRNLDASATEKRARARAYYTAASQLQTANGTSKIDEGHYRVLVAKITRRCVPRTALL